MERNAYATKTGCKIRGTYDLVPGCALIADGTWKRNKDGSIGYEWEGETEMFWDGQETQTRNGMTLYTDNEGNDWTEDEIELLTDEEWNAKWAEAEATEAMETHAD